MNRVILIGNLCADPKMRQTDSGISCCNFTVAIQRKFANANGQREADFLNCVAWRGTADFIGKYFSKGMRIALEGSVQTRSSQAQDGSKRYVTEILVDSAEFASTREDRPDVLNRNAQAAHEAPARAQQQRMDLYGFQEVEDDDLPF